MEFRNTSVNLRNSNLLRLPLNQKSKQITIDPNQFQDSEVTLICYKIHLIQQNAEVFVYLFKNINPTSLWYAMNIRDGDRLIILNEQNVTRISYEEVYSIMIEKKLPFTCQVVWHPELYIAFRTSNIKNNPMASQRLISDNMYEHLTQILRHLLDYQPKDPYKLFEKLVKKQEVSIDDQTEVYSLAQRQLTLLSNQATIEGNPEEIMTNIVEFNTLFEQIGIGLNREEIYWIWLSMKALLTEKTSIQKLSFWGKIFGIEKDYYIVEADVDTFDDFDLNDSEFIKYQEDFAVDEEDEMDENTININQKVPPDTIGNGINQKLFFVSTGIDKPFVQLPLVTPEQMELSRRIEQFFTGDLEASVQFESAFPGVEKHLLRAQIQRISAGTQIGPKNSFQIPINEEEEMGEETIAPNLTNVNVHNELEDLALPNGQYWVHRVPYIHQQNYKEEIRKLSPINEDTTIDSLYPAWSVGMAFTLVPEHTLIYVRSNRWPGAFTIGDRHRFQNIYMGWGVKNFQENHQANMINRFPEQEYEFEILEMDDPTIEEENEFFNSSRLLSPDENEEFEID